jgi:hypothetical protein
VRLLTVGIDVSLSAVSELGLVVVDRSVVLSVVVINTVCALRYVFSVLCPPPLLPLMVTAFPPPLPIGCDVVCCCWVVLFLVVILIVDFPFESALSLPL